MSKLLLCSLVLVVCAAGASADANDMPSLPVNGSTADPLSVGNFAINGPCDGGVNCIYFLGNAGFAAIGSGYFSANVFGTAQIAYSFTTGLPPHLDG